VQDSALLGPRHRSDRRTAAGRKRQGPRKRRSLCPADRRACRLRRPATQRPATRATGQEVRGGHRHGVGPSLGTPRESATAGRERVFSARAIPLYLKPSWRALRASSGVPLASPGFLWTSPCITRCVTPVLRLMAHDRASARFAATGRSAPRYHGFSAAEFLLNYGNYRKIIIVITIISEHYFKDIKSWPRRW
jgi:hypothetical protein